MHSALPQVATDLRRKGRPFRPFRRSSSAVGLVVLGIVLIYLFFVSGIHWTRSPPPRLGDYTGAHSTEKIVDSPYIVPDLTKLAEFRASHTVTLPDGQTVPSRTHSRIYRGPLKPKVVLVLGLDESYPQEYLAKIINDRLEYAKRHDYGLYVRYLGDFTVLSDDPTSQISAEFARVFLMREAAYAFKSAQWLWWLDQNAVIMNHAFSLSDSLLPSAKLTKHVLRDAPILPPESIIHTYKRVPAEQIRFILTQNDRGVSTSSFLVQNDMAYGNVLLNYWSDPLHRTYQGFKAWGGPDGHIDASLTHMVQWHPAILSRIAVVPHSVMGGFLDEGDVLKKQKYNDGDFALILRGTNDQTKTAPEKLMKQFDDAVGLRRKLV